MDVSDLVHFKRSVASIYFPPVGTTPLSGSTESGFRRCFLPSSFDFLFNNYFVFLMAFLFECESVRAVEPGHLLKTITLSAIHRGILSGVRIYFPYFNSCVTE